MSELLCPNCGEDLAAWLASRKPVIVVGGAFVEEEPNNLPGVGCCRFCRTAFTSDAATFIQPATEADIRGLHPMTRAVLSDYLRGASADDQREVLKRHGPVAR